MVNTWLATQGSVVWHNMINRLIIFSLQLMKYDSDDVEALLFYNQCQFDVRILKLKREGK